MRKRLLTCIGLFGILLLAAPQGFADAGIQTKRVPQTSPASGELPFSIEELVQYFKTAFERPPRKLSERAFVFTDRRNPHESVSLTVSGESSRGVVVALWATGDYGVNYIRELFEAPFFRRSESESLYALLDHGLGTRSADIGRFHVHLAAVEANQWIVIKIEFGPRESARESAAVGASGNVQ